MRFRLRTLMIVLAIGPPALAGVWWELTTQQAVTPTLLHYGDHDLEEWRPHLDAPTLTGR